MRTNLEEIEQVLRTEGVISRRRHPALGRVGRSLAERGELVRVLPGVYASAASATTVRTRIAALMAYDPDAVLTAAAAASASFWPQVSVETVTCAVR